jgi:hypothetical protein
LQIAQCRTRPLYTAVRVWGYSARVRDARPVNLDFSITQAVQGDSGAGAVSGLRGVDRAGRAVPVTGEGYGAATVSILIKTFLLYLIMVTGAIWEKVVFGQYLFAPAFFWEDVVSFGVIALHTAYLWGLLTGSMSPAGADVAGAGGLCHLHRQRGPVPVETAHGPAGGAPTGSQPANRPGVAA